VFQKAPGRFASPPGELSFLPSVAWASSPCALVPPHILRPVPRIALFTDTLADVNGVSRFVRALALHAPDLHILTSTRRHVPAAPNIHNVHPMLSCRMPGYAMLDLSVPRPGALAARALNPDVVHVSTPGPVGLAGRRFAMRHGLPLVGTYHTDFPAYVEHLFDDVALTAAAARVLRWFYAPFDRVLVRSAGVIPRVAALGIPPDRIVALTPGIDTDRFHPRHRDPAIWSTLPGVRPSSVKALYVGRLSVEKNLAMLARIWPRIYSAASTRGVDTQLLLVGDGPYRATMERQIGGHAACFLGFRHGDQLSRLYASSDLFLFPSATDTLGQAVMEAQSSGVPAIVMDEGGPREIVQHGRTGLVVGTPTELRIAALSLILSPERRSAMSAAAREHLAPMTIARSVDHFLALHAQGPKNKPGHTLACGPARR
jgi:glycosyltransferase involved in cell wall biosynthesis